MIGVCLGEALEVDAETFTLDKARRATKGFKMSESFYPQLNTMKQGCSASHHSIKGGILRGPPGAPHLVLKT